MRSNSIINTILIFILLNVRDAYANLPSKRGSNLRGSQLVSKFELDGHKGMRSLQKGDEKKSKKKGKQKDKEKGAIFQFEDGSSSVGISSQMFGMFNNALGNLPTNNSQSDEELPNEGDEGLPTVSEIESPWESVINEMDNEEQNAAPPVFIDPECTEKYYHIQQQDDTGSIILDFYLDIYSGNCVVIGHIGCPDHFDDDHISHADCGPNELGNEKQNAAPAVFIDRPNELGNEEQNAAPAVFIDPECTEKYYHIQQQDDTGSIILDFYLDIHSGKCVVIGHIGCPDHFDDDHISHADCGP